MSCCGQSQHRKRTTPKPEQVLILIRYLGRVENITWYGSATGIRYRWYQNECYVDERDLTLLLSNSLYEKR